MTDSYRERVAYTLAIVASIAAVIVLAALACFGCATAGATAGITAATVTVSTIDEGVQVYRRHAREEIQRMSDKAKATCPAGDLPCKLAIEPELRDALRKADAVLLAFTEAEEAARVCAEHSGNVSVCFVEVGKLVGPVTDTLARFGIRVPGRR